MGLMQSRCGSHGISEFIQRLVGVESGLNRDNQGRHGAMMAHHFCSGRECDSRLALLRFETVVIELGEMLGWVFLETCLTSKL